MNRATLFVIFCIFLLFLILGFSFNQSNEKQAWNKTIELRENKTKENHTTVECMVGEKRACLTKNNCSGYQICGENLRYSNCYANKKICVPGSKKGCIYNTCVMGIKICNKCGTAYGPCQLEKNN